LCTLWPIDSVTEFVGLFCFHRSTLIQPHLGLFTVMQLHQKMIWYVHFLTSCNQSSKLTYVCECSVSWKVTKVLLNVFSSSGKIPGIMVFASVGKKCFNVCINPVTTDSLPTSWKLSVTGICSTQNATEKQFLDLSELCIRWLGYMFVNSHAPRTTNGRLNSGNSEYALNLLKMLGHKISSNNLLNSVNFVNWSWQ